MTELDFKNLLLEAMNEYYSDIPNPEDLEYEYQFSEKFEKSMQQMMREYEITIKEKSLSCKNVKVKHTFRRTVIIILSAILVLTLAAFTMHFLKIKWLETSNEKQGTLDVSFDIEKSYEKDDNFKAKHPETPRGFKIIEEESYPDIKTVKYKNSLDEIIDYYQEIGVEGMGLSVDNDDEEFSQISVNGYKGYAVKDKTNPCIIWTDGIYLYYLAGNVEYSILEKMAESIK